MSKSRRPYLTENLDFDGRDEKFALIKAGAQFNRICESKTKAGKDCTTNSLIFTERSVCGNHATNKEILLNRMKIGTVMSQLQNQALFGDW